MKKISTLFVGIALSLGGLLLFVTTLRAAVSPASDEVDPGAGTASSTVIATSSVSQGETAAPAKLFIPAIALKAAVQKVGKTASGAIATPKGFVDVGWYRYGPVPGEKGVAVIDGHLDNALGMDGVFKHLGDLQIGDLAYVQGENGEFATFRVIDTKIVPYTAQLSDALRSVQEGKSYLALITCEGSWVSQVHSYDKRQVVLAERIR